MYLSTHSTKSQQWAPSCSPLQPFSQCLYFIFNFLKSKHAVWADPQSKLIIALLLYTQKFWACHLAVFYEAHILFFFSLFSTVLMYEFATVSATHTVYSFLFFYIKYFIRKKKKKRGIDYSNFTSFIIPLQRDFTAGQWKKSWLSSLFIESENDRMAWLKGILKIMQLQLPPLGRVATHQIRFPRVQSNLVLNASRGGASTASASLGSRSHCLTALWMKIFHLTSNLNFLLFNLKPFPLDLSLSAQ